MKLPTWNIVHNNDIGSKGHILILIDKSVWHYAMVSLSQQHVTLMLSNKGGLQCNCSCVYASISFSERQKLWDLLHLDTSTIGSPWLVIGDLNTALNQKDKKGGLPILFSYLNSFKNCLFNYGLVEYPIQGCKYTWRHRGISMNIDKALVNYEFMSLF